MEFSLLLFLILLFNTLPSLSLTVAAAPQRGLVHIPSNDHPTDDAIWTSNPSPLTWYYNYQPSASASYVSSSMAFVPMLWGDYANTFAPDVTALLRCGTNNIDGVLGFNELDMKNEWGGSEITPVRAAELWKRDLEPLVGLTKVGAPAVAGWDGGVQWLKDWDVACAGGCHYDFIPLHYYGDFQGFASYLGYVNATFPGKELWITELGCPQVDLAATQECYKQMEDYILKIKEITRWTWFGSFRSDVSNVGPNSAMLNTNGELTDIGAWFLGRPGTGVTP